MRVIKNLLSLHDVIPQFSTNGEREPVELRKKILLTLWVLGNPECLRSVVDRFNVLQIDSVPGL